MYLYVPSNFLSTYYLFQLEVQDGFEKKFASYLLSLFVLYFLGIKFGLLHGLLLILALRNAILILTKIPKEELAYCHIELGRSISQNGGRTNSRGHIKCPCPPTLYNIIFKTERRNLTNFHHFHVYHIFDGQWA